MLSQSCFVWPLFPGQLKHVAGLSIPATCMAFDEEMLPVTRGEGSDGAEHEPGAPSGDDGDSSDAQPDADMGRARHAWQRPTKKYSPSCLINFLRLSRLLDKL